MVLAHEEQLFPSPSFCFTYIFMSLYLSEYFLYCLPQRQSSEGDKELQSRTNWSIRLAHTGKWRMRATQGSEEDPNWARTILFITLAKDSSSVP